MKLLSLTLTLLVLVSCAPKPPPCNDPQVSETLTKLVFEKLQNVSSGIVSAKSLAELDAPETRNAVLLKDARPTALNKEINQYSCLAILEYTLQEPTKYADKALDAKAFAHVAAQISGLARSVENIPEALESVYSRSDNKIKMDIHYTTQVVDGDKVYVSFNVEDLKLLGFQLSILMDRKAMKEAPSNNDFDKLVRDLSLDHSHQTPSSTDDQNDANNQKLNFVSGAGKDLGVAGHLGLQEDEIKIISRMPSHFIKAYQSGGTIQVSGERAKCYEAAKQIADRSLVIQCIALDAVGCGIIPSMEKNSGFPPDTDFSEKSCFQRALVISSVLYTSEIEQKKFIKAVIKQAIQEVNNYDWDSLDK